MKLHPKALERASHRLLVGFILFEVLIVVIYLGSILLAGKPYPPFDMNGQMTVPSLLQAFLLFLIGFISLLFFIFDRSRSEPPSRSFMLGIAVLLLYASVDEIFKIHLQLHALIPILPVDWVPIYVFLFFLPLALFYRDFIALWNSHRKPTFLALVGMAMFGLGGFGSEIVKQVFFLPVSGMFLPQSQLTASLVEKSRVAFEEFFELLGETLIVYGILLFVAKRLEKTK